MGFGMYRDLHGGDHHSTWIPGSSPLVVDTTSCCCPSLLTYTTCGVWLSSSSLCESVSSMLMDSSGVLRWIPSIWSSGDVHDDGDIQYLDPQIQHMVSVVSTYSIIGCSMLHPSAEGLVPMAIPIAVLTAIRECPWMATWTPPWRRCLPLAPCIQ